MTGESRRDFNVVVLIAVELDPYAEAPAPPAEATPPS